MKEDNGMVKTPKTPTDGNSQNKMGVMRYPLEYKSKAIQIFKDEYSEFFDVHRIRYIF